MKQILLEGTDKQINLILSVISKASEIFPKYKLDLPLSNLWSTEDVKAICDCTDEQAMEILTSALSSEYIVSEIGYSISATAEAKGLKLKEDLF